MARSDVFFSHNDWRMGESEREANDCSGLLCSESSLSGATQVLETQVSGAFHRWLGR
jgi:hypothetical protein